jgi:hypothetical protein
VESSRGWGGPESFFWQVSEFLSCMGILEFVLQSSGVLLSPLDSISFLLEVSRCLLSSILGVVPDESGVLGLYGVSACLSQFLAYEQTVEGLEHLGCRVCCQWLVCCVGRRHLRTPLCLNEERNFLLLSGTNRTNKYCRFGFGPELCGWVR